MYDIVIPYVCPLRNDHHGRSNYQLSPYKVITIVWSTFPMLYNLIPVTHLFFNWSTFPLLYNLIPVTHLFFNWKFVPFYLPHLFYSSPHFPPFWPPPTCSLYLRVFLSCHVCSFVLFFRVYA